MENERDVRALTLRQPWADAVAERGKNVENRSWSTGYRGLLAIHAGLRTDRLLLDGDHPLARRPISHEHPLGQVVAVAVLHDVHLADRSTCKRQCNPWGEYPESRPTELPGEPESKPIYHWMLRDILRLSSPYPLTGGLGIRTIPTDQAEDIIRLTWPA